MKRVFFALLLWVGLVGAAQAGSIPTGIWYDPTKSGLGVMVFESGGNTLIYYYTYSKINRSPGWLLGVVDSNSPKTSYDFTFNYFSNSTFVTEVYDPAKLASSPESSATITVNGTNSMTLNIITSIHSYWVGTLNLVRLP